MLSRRILYSAPYPEQRVSRRFLCRRGLEYPRMKRYAAISTMPTAMFIPAPAAFLARRERYCQHRQDYRGKRQGETLVFLGDKSLDIWRTALFFEFYKAGEGHRIFFVAYGLVHGKICRSKSKNSIFGIIRRYFFSSVRPQVTSETVRQVVPSGVLVVREIIGSEFVYQSSGRVIFLESEFRARIAPYVPLADVYYFAFATCLCMFWTYCISGLSFFTYLASNARRLPLEYGRRKLFISKPAAVSPTAP